MQPDFGSGSVGRAGMSPFARPTLVEQESKDERRRRKDAERMVESRPLEPWERYRALGDHVDHLLNVTELADRKTRFALVILGALNAVNLLVAIRAPQLGADGLSHTFLQLYIAGYVLLSLYFFVFAIIALRPRSREMSGTSTAREGAPGLRLPGDILDRDPDAYYDTWRHADLSQVNREMAHQSYLLARTNAEKFQALRRVYQGLLVLVGLTAALTIVIGIHVLAPSGLGF
jgi:hypothetical protein